MKCRIIIIVYPMIKVWAKTNHLTLMLYCNHNSVIKFNPMKPSESCKGPTWMLKFCLSMPNQTSTCYEVSINIFILRLYPLLLCLVVPFAAYWNDFLHQRFMLLNYWSWQSKWKQIHVFVNFVYSEQKWNLCTTRITQVRDVMWLVYVFNIFDIQILLKLVAI